MTSLREYLKTLETQGKLRRIASPLSAVHEMASVLERVRGPVLFEQVEGFSHPVVGGICSSRKSLCASLGIASEEFPAHFHRALGGPSPCRIGPGPVLERVCPPELSDIPVLTHYPQDQGPYITAGVVYAKEPGGNGANASFHRMNVLDDRRLSICIQPGHLAQFLEKQRHLGEKSLDVSISLGLHPAVLLACAGPAEYGVSEFEVANTLVGGDLVLSPCPHVDALAPAEAELVLEGRILIGEQAREGPYVCVAGTWKEASMQPVVEIVGVMRRDDYLYQALLAASPEHRLLEGMPNEVRVWAQVRKAVPSLRAVHLTPGGGGWLHAVASVEKTRQGDGKQLLAAMFGALPPLKHAVAVDSDIDPFDMEQVEWALATRFQADQDLVIIPGAYASRLDPSSELQDMTGCKLGLDATRPLGKPAERFTKGTIPPSARVKSVVNLF